MIEVGDMYTDQEVNVKSYEQHLLQTLAMIDFLVCIRDISPTGLLHSFDPGDTVLLKTWKTGSPDSQLEKRWTGTLCQANLIYFMTCR